MQIIQTFENEQYVFRLENMTLTIAFDVVADAKFYGYNLLDQNFIESIFRKR